MAWLGGDGFDFYNLDEGAAQWGDAPWAATFGTLIAKTPFGEGFAWHTNGDQWNESNQFTPSSTVYVNYQFYNDNAAYVVGGTSTGTGVQFFDGTTAQCGFYVRTGGDFIVTNGPPNGTILATSPKLLANAAADGVWHHIQIKCVINNTTGSFTIRLDNNSSDDWTSGNINTRQGTSNAQATMIKVGNNLGTSGFGWNIDDCYWFNDQGAQPNTWQGVIKGYSYYPNGDNSVSWTRNSGATNASCVNQRYDGDTTYVSTNTPGNVDRYTLPPLPSTPLNIVAVQTRASIRFDDAGPHTAKSRLWSGSTTSDSVVATLSASYQQIWKAYTTDPATGAAWAASTLSGLNLGIVDVS